MNYSFSFFNSLPSRLAEACHVCFVYQQDPSRALHAAVMHVVLQTSPTNLSWSELIMICPPVPPIQMCVSRRSQLARLSSVFKRHCHWRKKFTYVPRTSLNSNNCLMSLTCFFHESLAVSPFSWAMAETVKSADTSLLQQLPVTLLERSPEETVLSHGSVYTYACRSLARACRTTVKRELSFVRGVECHGLCYTTTLFSPLPSV